MSQKVESCIICENYRFWLELQLVDDKGQPLANVPYSLTERGTGRTMQGSSDPQGLIKAEGLTARPYTLSFEPQPLADALTAMSPPAAIQGNDKSLSDYCREQGYLLSENNRAGAFNPNVPTTVHRMTAGQISRSTHYQQRDKGYPLLFPYDHRRVIAIKRIAEPVFAKSTLRGLGNTDAGDTVEDLANFGLCDYNAYTCGIDAAAKQPSQRSSSFLSLLGIGTANAMTVPVPAPMPPPTPAGNSPFDYSNSASGRPVWQSENDYTIAKGVSKGFGSSTWFDSARVLVGMIPNIYDGDSLTHPDLLEIAEIGGTAPTRMRVGFASTGTTAAAMASASQLIAYHTERDSGYDQVPVIKGELASEAEAREVLSLPIYQSPNGLPTLNTQAEIYRFDADGTTLYMGVAASGEIINISARIDDIPNEPIIHAGPSPLPQKVEKPEGFAIHDFDYRPETLPVADDGIVWRHTGHDVEPIDFRDYILTVDRKDVKPVYTSLNPKIPGLDEPLRGPHPNYPPNQDVLDKMNSPEYQAKVEDENYDCSEIARDLKEAAGGQGEILEVRSTEKYGSINVFENGITEGDMGYHQVYSDGKYIYEPRISSQAIPKGDWEKHIKGINDGKLTITNKPTGLK